VTIPFKNCPVVAGYRFGLDWKAFYIYYRPGKPLDVAHVVKAVRKGRV
jgi:hypothetical protein